MPVIDFDPPERFIAGTVGPPGQRQFYLQAAAAGRVVSVAAEKGQVAMLGERIGEMLTEYATHRASEDIADNAPLDMPIDEEFTVGTIRLDWDPLTELLVLHLVPYGADVDDTTDLALLDVPVVRVALRPETARAFARRCALVVAAGRPACPFCGNPIDPTGHICPRANGYKR